MYAIRFTCCVWQETIVRSHTHMCTSHVPFHIEDVTEVWLWVEVAVSCVVYGWLQALSGILNAECSNDLDR